MRILALETTERIGSVAAMGDDKLLCELKLSSTMRSAQSLAPGVRELWSQVGWKPRDVDLVAVSVGPGSFTGARIGVTMAKTLAYCLGADILGIDTLDVIASGAVASVAPEHVGVLSVAVDAQRREVVARSFRRGNDGSFAAEGPSRLVKIDAWLSGLRSGTTVTGPIMRKLADRVPKGVTVLAPEYWPPSAAAIARLAAQQYAAGRRDDLWGLLPIYSRRSAAEEAWEEKRL